MSKGLRLFIRSRVLAAMRRWSIFRSGEFDPYPDVPDGMSFSPSQRNTSFAATLVPKLDWATHGRGDVRAWQETAREKWRDLLCLSNEPLSLETLGKRDMPIANGYERKRAYLRFAQGCDAPVDIVRRAGAVSENKAPVVICMQGTNAGAHLNLGEVRMPADIYKVNAGSALALQAADNGYIAVSFERACFGERRERVLDKRSPGPAVDAAFHALVAGETLLGQTVSELEALRLWVDSEVAPGAPVYLAGYSAAGTAAIAAAACCEGFAGIAVGGCVGMIRDTLLTRGASGYNDIPDILNWFEFDALLALIAPRTCLIITGEKDHIWPRAGAEKVVRSARSAWPKGSSTGQLELVHAPGGHTYYPELMWPALERMIAGNA